MTDKVAIEELAFSVEATVISFARGGHRVTLFDADDKAVVKTNQHNREFCLRTLELRGMLKGQTAADVRSRMTARRLPEDKLCRCRSSARKTLPEDLEVKREMFPELDAASEKNAVLASSSSGILPSRISTELARRMALSPRASDQSSLPHSRGRTRAGAVDRSTGAWSARANGWRRSVRCRLCGARRELNRIIMNRLQGALLHEAFRLVAEGYATSEDVDAGICKGIGLRWAFIRAGRNN